MIKTLQENDPLLDKARELARAASEQGGRALLVGGYVRDALLGLKPKDADVEVFGLEADALRGVLRRLGRVNCVGESFQVFKLVWYEKTGGEKQRFELDVSLPRRDRRTGRGHRGFTIAGDPRMTIEDAARRRDFTINAMMCDPLSGELLDPFGGRDDLERKVLRAVDARHFGEDSLRVLRAVQFVARFEMTVAPETIELCRSIALDDLPAERIWGEWEKLLIQSRRPSPGLRSADELGVLAKLFPAIEAAMQRRGEELCAALDRAAGERAELPYPKQVTLMLATLGQFLGRAAAEELLDALHVYTLEGYDVRANVLRFIGEPKRVSDWYRKKEGVEDKEFRFLAARCEPMMIYRLTRARGDSEAATWFLEKMQSLGVAGGPPRPLLMGRHLLEMGLKPGPLIGKITGAVWIMQLKGDVSTLDDARTAARELIEKQMESGDL